MNALFGAVALIVAAPVAAQTPPADAHAKHQSADHSQHKQADHDCKACCEKMKSESAKMDCRGSNAGTAASSSDAHTGHAH